MLGYYAEENKHYLYDAFTLDGEGNLYILLVSALGKILKFDRELKLIKEIDVSTATLLHLFAHKPPQLCTGWIGGIFLNAQGEIVLGTHDDQVLVLDQEGHFLARYPMEKNRCHLPVNEPRFARNFYQLSDGHVLLLTHKASGTILSRSKTAHPDFSKVFPSYYLNCVLSVARTEQLAEYDFLEGLPREDFESIGLAIRKLKMSFAQDPPGAYTHYPGELKIHQVLELPGNKLLLLVMTSARNKSDSANKNMPYFLYLMDLATGAVLKKISPPDRSIYKENFNGKLVAWDQDHLLLKTYENIFLLDHQLNIVETLSLKERAFSLIRAMAVIAKHESTIFFANQMKGKIISYPFTGKLSLDLQQLCKDLRARNKAERAK